MRDRFDIDQVIKITGLGIHAEQADGGADFDVACQIAVKKLWKIKEYESLEEQNRLLRLPCAVGDTVYCIYSRYTKCSAHNQEFEESSCLGCESECDSEKEYYVKEQRAYSLDWIVTQIVCKHFSKTVFLTREEAEAALEELERGKGE